MDSTNKDIDIMHGILLLILAVSGNFIAETLGCNLQKLLRENMLAKHILIIFIIYISLGFTSDYNPDPVILLGNSISICELLILFTRMSLPFNIAVFSLLFIYYFIDTYINYYSAKDKKKYKKTIDSYNQILKYLKYLIIGLVIIGFVFYLNKQRNDYGKNWSTFKYIFGMQKCKSVK